MSVTPDACAACKTTGLPILPVRYTVVPSTIKLGLPSWASGDRVTSVDLSEGLKYALRTLRAGYVYLFHARHVHGPNRWECYTVYQDGSLERHASPDFAQADPKPTIACDRIAHQPAARHCIVIEQPEKSGPVWIAFSQHRWSPETRATYFRDTALRNARMQTLHPAQMIQGAKHTHGAVATRESLEQVLEYAISTDTHSLPCNQSPGNISLGDDGRYNEERMRLVSTRYPWSLRVPSGDPAAAPVATAEVMAEHLRSRAKRAGDQPGTPHVLALWDAMGIVHELNGFRNDAIGWVGKYQEERALQLGAIANYDALKATLQREASARADEQIERIQSTYDPLKVREMRAIQGQHQSPGEYFWTNELVEIREERKRQKEASARGAEDFKRRTIAAAWSSYEARLDKRLPVFRQNMARFETATTELAERRTQALVNWLQAQPFLDTLGDFNGQCEQEGLAFDACIGKAVCGMESSQCGRKLIDTWVAEATATSQGSLLWRSLALNQDQARESLDVALAEANRHTAEKTLSTGLVWINFSTKILKPFADLYKKVNAAVKPGEALSGMDQLVLTAGDRIFKRFRIDQLGDFVGEKIIQHVLSIRGGVSQEDSLNLIRTQALYDRISREQTLRRLQSAKAFLGMGTPEVQTLERTSLKLAWEKFKPEPGGVVAVREARLAVVILLIEGLNFSKLIAECRAKNDAKTTVSLIAAGMSVTAALLEVASTPSKALVEMGGREGWTFARLKLIGGTLSGSASIITGIVDMADGNKAAQEGYRTLRYATYGKGIAGAISGTLTIASTFTYAVPYIEKITGKTIITTALKAGGERATAWLLFRCAGLTVGAEITIIIFSLQILVWQLTPNEIEKWIDHSAFGKMRLSGGYTDSNAQDMALNQAIAEMGLR